MKVKSNLLIIPGALSTKPGSRKYFLVRCDCGCKPLAIKLNIHRWQVKCFNCKVSGLIHKTRREVAYWWNLCHTH